MSCGSNVQPWISILSPRGKFICPVQSKAAGEDNVDKVLALFIKAAFNRVFCNHVGWF
jgi:hypothetical protein